MTELQQEVLAAFIDAEAVDPRALADALSEPEGRDYLIDLLALRGLMAGQPADRSAIATASPRPFRVRRFAVAASLAAVSVLGGYVWGHRSAGALRTPEDVASVATRDAVSAPAPTRVIRLENGVDWSERSGR